MLKSTSGTDGRLAGRPPHFAKGTWYREPSTVSRAFFDQTFYVSHVPQDAHEDDRNDVIVLDDGSDPKLYTLTDRPGQMRPQVIPKPGQKSHVKVKPVTVERLVGFWRLMPAVSDLLLQVYNF